MGRHSAGESFLRGFILHSHANEFWLQVTRSEYADSFRSVADRLGKRQPLRVVDYRQSSLLENVGGVFHPHPDISEAAFQREFYGSNKWSLCGITHTTASARVMDAITRWLTAPIQSWDAVICTSQAVRDNVKRVMMAEADRLRERLAVGRLMLPQLPVIPIGVHADEFTFDSQERLQSRKILQIDLNTLVVLFVGRLSFHAKAHPLAMYQALEAARQATGCSVHLVECGWYANDAIRNAFEAAARLACPGVSVTRLDGRNPRQLRLAWAVADIFCSLSDNLQESFGITPIEAMASGLPVVVSDWNGYRDTVRHEVDGFRVPTMQPSPGLCTDIALRHALGIDSYDRYCGQTSSLVAVDVQAVARAFIELFNNQDLRRRMGAAGRAHVCQQYDWSVIIRRYEDLMDELAHLRMDARSSRHSRYPWPARMDPFEAFAAYPTETLTYSTRFSLVDSNPEHAVRRLRDYLNLTMVNFSLRALPTPSESEEILSFLAGGPLPAQVLVESFAKSRQPIIYRGLCWLLKLGLLQSVAASSVDDV